MKNVGVLSLFSKKISTKAEDHINPDSAIGFVTVSWNSPKRTFWRNGYTAFESSSIAPIDVFSG